MLLLPCAFLALGQSVEFTIPVRHDSPSRIVELMRGSDGHPGVVTPTMRLAADDPKHTIHVQGSAADVLAAREYVKILDIDHPMARVKVHIQTASDPQGFDMTTSVQSNKMWKVSDEGTGLSIALCPRFDADNTTLVKLLVGYPGGNRELTVRLKDAEKYVVDLGSKKSVSSWPALDGSVDAAAEEQSLPKLTFQVTRGKG